MMKFFSRSVSVAALAALVTPAAVYAQVTTSGVRGQVIDEAGVSISGATVSIVHEPTGTVTAATTNENGQFAGQGLRVGGPYSITVSGSGIAPSRVEGIFANLGETATIDIRVARADDTARLETVVVTGSAVQVGQVATGPSAVFNLATLENAPAASRDIKEILRADPRIYVDDGFNDAVQCAGANPRYNSLTVDGARLQDNFGLNSNGYPTENMPFSFDSIEQVSVELAPFNVEYGQFTACNINAVTKSGTNEIHGGLFFDYTSNDFRGDKLDGKAIDIGKFEEKRYGFNVGLPIWKDRLFFFGSYEKAESANIFDNSPARAGITQATYDQVLAIATSQYGYVAGGLPASLAVEDEKIFAKLDWNITDSHRAALTYNWNDGFNFNPSDASTTEVSDGNHFYERGAELTNYTLSLNSDWTPNFSTELRATLVDLDNRQIPVSGLGAFGEVQVRVPRASGTGTSTVYLGADDSRHANDLNYTTDIYKAKADWSLGNHKLTFGGEREEFEVFNLFIQEVQGEWVFNSIADFAAGRFSDFRYENAARTNNQDDGAAKFGYEINTIYLQDEWQATDKLNLVAGLRYDFYTSSDKPSFNQTFFNTYGVRNDANMDERDLIQPRVGFSYDQSDDFRLHGGFGLYAGGNPNVWLSNNYSNNGVTLFECRERNGTAGATDCLPAIGGTTPNISNYIYRGGQGRPFFDVPDQAIAAVAAARGGGPVNALDPNFEIPSEWKAAIGFLWDFGSEDRWFGDNWRLMVDGLLSQTNEAAVVLPISFRTTSVAADGRPIYTGNTNDFVLTNAQEKGSARVLSLALSKSYDFGLDWDVAYAFTDAKDVNPMTSSVAFSNFINVQSFDALSPQAATSDYVIPHRLTFNLSYGKEFFEGLETKFSMFATANEGSPYSYTITVADTIPAGLRAFTPVFGERRQLAYIPTGISDPAISPTSNAGAVAALNAFIGTHDLSSARGTIVDRNSEFDRWRNRVDIRFAQELPGLMEGHSSEAFVNVRNVGNLINDQWGLLKEHGFPGNANLYNINGVDSQGRLVITSFNPQVDQPGEASRSASPWQVRFGVKYKF